MKGRRESNDLTRLGQECDRRRRGAVGGLSGVETDRLELDR
jgi:hypothetical protein